MRSLTAEVGAAAMPDSLDAVGVTFAWATSPADADDAEGLLSCADQRLLARKRESKLALA